jgi:hypothetical protein
MGLFRSLVYSTLLDRLLRGGRGGIVDPRRYGPRYGAGPGYGAGYRSGYRPPARRNGIRFAGPLPYYQGTTRRGSRVSVGGCCLPIPLTVLATGTAVALGRRHLGG